MSRPLIATLLGLLFVTAYTAVVITLPDILPQHWALQAVYFIIAGIAWVFPVRWLMLWSVHKR